MARPKKLPTTGESLPQLSPEDLSKAISATLDEFLPYQQAYIYDANRFVAVEKAVRIGITYAHSFKASLKRVMRDPFAKRSNELFASKNRQTASEYLSYHRHWAKYWNTLFGESFIDLDKWTSEVGRYPGGDIIIVSSDPNSFRGMSGDVTLDEFAFHEQQNALFSAAQSRSQWLDDGQVTLISSHSHPESVFAQLVNDHRADPEKAVVQSVHRVTLYEAVKQGLALKVPGKHRDCVRGRHSKDPKKIEQCNAAFIESIRKTCLSEEDFAREYLCEPAKLSALVSADEYEKCVIENAVPDHLDAGVPFGELFMGVDCGVRHDLTVLWALQRGFNKAGESCYRSVCVKPIRGMSFPEQAQVLSPMLRHDDICKGFIDQGVQGRSLADAVKDYTGSIIEPYQFTGPRKAEMYERLRAFIQMRRISLPPNPDCKRDFLSVRREVTQGGAVKYEAGGRLSHGDYFAACALALHAAEAGSAMMTMLGEPAVSEEVAA